jgi:tRNA-2-methylthio-N6-dimethylallyladenosine synthase
VPYTRGRLNSRDYKEILKEIKELIKKDYKEIWLLGENVNDYHYGKMDFVSLIKEIDKIQGNFWLRFTSPHPKDFSKQMIEVLAKSPKITPYLNLPLQSGDNQVLKAMNRPYTVEQYKTLVKALRKAFKAQEKDNLAISTDIIVGFPEETKAQFDNTFKAMETIKFDMAYISQYSPRPESLCFNKMKDNVSKKEKRERDSKLNKLLAKTTLEKNKTEKGKIVEVLVLEKSKEYLLGKTKNYKTIKFKGSESLIGNFVKVRINKIQAFGFEGELVKDKLIVILGPTASGKTDLAIKIAKKYS